MATPALPTQPLPIDAILPQLQQTLATHPNVVLQAPPGAGKTTRIPLALLTSAWLQNKKIIMLEPRRLAARSAAHFMATVLNEPVGQTVGYRVRMDNKVGPGTRIEVVTEGILTRLLQSDPALSDVGIVIFDEYHERSLHADLGLALCLESQAGLRHDLRLLIMSATLDGAAVAQLLGNAPIISSQGRSHPVTTHYRPITANPLRDPKTFWPAVGQQILSVIQNDTGNILVFLPGSGEIRRIEQQLRASVNTNSIIIAPLHGQLDYRTQDTAIQDTPAGKRKIVLATSIAETSLTIDGIRIVIDCGLSRVPRFDPNTALTQLTTISVSRAAADQRRGRAGRLQAGVCYRLWAEHIALIPYHNPEILEADLAPLCLELAAWGVLDPQQLAWLNPPPAAHLAQAIELLQQLHALDTDKRITPHGRAMATLATHPRLAHMILHAKTLGLATLACEIAALLEERDPLRAAVARNADLRLRLEVLRGLDRAASLDQGSLQRIKENARRWQQQLHATPAPTDHSDLARTGLLVSLAYPDRIAQQRAGSTRRYVLSNGRGAVLSEADPLMSHQYIVTAHLDGAAEARIYLAAPIEPAEVVQHHRAHLLNHNDIHWDHTQQAVVARQQQRLGALLITDAPLAQIDPAQVHAALLTGIRLHGLDCLPWEDATRQWQARVDCLHRLQPQDWPLVDDTQLLASLETWLLPYIQDLTRLSQLKRVDLLAALRSLLTWKQQSQLDSLAPTHITVPSGSQIRLDYTRSPPTLAVRLQELFGLADTPRIGGGRIPLVLHLLSPARRPVQITQDLAGFWAGSYHEVKKDLKGRYPKHFWPDDPAHAQATARAKPRK
ncbi:MAG: ATP-dependent helicase HrpB [Gammaproteobacteria bacterium]|nr:ATP-dependent helicase HrpB [Gammaproteobacteria bacterium]